MRPAVVLGILAAALILVMIDTAEQASNFDARFDRAERLIREKSADIERDLKQRENAAMAEE